MPARMQATAEDKRTAEDRPTRDYSNRPAPSAAYAERELTRKELPAKWRTTSLAFLPCCASGHSESGSVQDAESLRELRHLHGGTWKTAQACCGKR